MGREVVHATFLPDTPGPTSLPHSEADGKMKFKKGMRAAGYTRVSTNGQVEHGSSLAGQREEVAQFCEEHSLNLLNIYEEAGVSGGNGIEDRIALPDLLLDLAPTEIEAVVVTRLDRLSRDLAVQETIFADLMARGVALESIAEPDLCSDEPSRVLIRQMFGAVGQYEKSMIVARLAAGRRRKRNNGEAGWAGEAVAFGYKIAGRGPAAHVIIDPLQAPIVRFIFWEYNHGANMGDIVRKLRAKKVAAKHGGQFSRQSVGHILHNHTYSDGTFPRIVPRKTFERAKERRACRRKSTSINAT